ncbi:MAG: helix-turn-helix transcriptional regulator [Oscillospiraceae bacterium]|jgi:transcriptional regulator with XRE-family HTH domain|nr:helix-turn-helix transcriptional regulator [Oscillospiraceae bacterium]
MLSKKLFGQRLRQLRMDHQEKQDVLADLLDVSVPQISGIENGYNSTTLEKLVLICEHYKVSSDYLLGLSDTP